MGKNQSKGSGANGPSAGVWGRAAPNVSPTSSPLRVALAGNQNCGKTTLFNRLTGANQKVGNWPGVTVEKKEGTLRHNGEISLIDLPGIYSISPYTMEEVVSRNYILDEHPDCVINVVDATNIERSLYLTLQLAELGVPMVLALNMMDELKRYGDAVDVKGLEEALGMPVVPISAARGDGVHELVHRVIHAARHGEAPPHRDICEGSVHKAVHAIAHLAEDKARLRGYSARYAATKLAEGDAPVAEALAMSADEMHIIGEIVAQMERETGMDREAALADARYTYITDIVGRCVKKRRAFGEPTRSDKIDKLLTHRVLAIPVFVAIMLCVFLLTFGPAGRGLADGLAYLIDMGIGAVDGLLEAGGASAWVRALIVDGALTGIGSVLSFLPYILILFLCLSVMEDSGYMARAAFLMDKPLRALGLSGRSFIPLLMGFGCTVPAVIATRALDNVRDKKLTIFLTPFMSCGAKVPIYTLLAAALFPGHSALALFSIYLLGVAVAVIAGLTLKRTVMEGEAAPFIMELPTYRLPSPRSVLLQLKDKTWDFVTRAFTVIFAASVLIWLAGNLSFTLDYIPGDPSSSILARVGSFIAPAFAPLGIGTWQNVTALLAGLSAKEAVISTLGVLHNADAAGLADLMRTTLFTPLSAYAFMAFTLLYMPCVAAFAVVRREAGLRFAVLAALGQTGIAWCVAALIYQAGSLFG